MVFDKTLPLPIRNNNPGALHSCVAVDYRTERNEGLAVFRTRTDGLKALAVTLHDLYMLHSCHSVFQLLSRYAVQSESDVDLYIKRVCARAGLNPLLAKTSDLRFDQAWRVMDFMRGIIWVENGIPRTDWPSFPEWCSGSEMVMALQDTQRWRTV